MTTSFEPFTPVLHPKVTDTVHLDGYPSLKQNCRCYTFWQSDILIRQMPMYRVAELIEDRERERLGDNDFAWHDREYRWEAFNQRFSKQAQGLIFLDGIGPESVNPENAWPLNQGETFNYS